MAGSRRLLLAGILLVSIALIIDGADAKKKRDERRGSKDGRGRNEKIKSLNDGKQGKKWQKEKNVEQKGKKDNRRGKDENLETAVKEENKKNADSLAQPELKSKDKKKQQEADISRKGKQGKNVKEQAKEGSKKGRTVEGKAVKEESAKNSKKPEKKVKVEEVESVKPKEKAAKVKRSVPAEDTVEEEVQTIEEPTPEAAEPAQVQDGGCQCEKSVKSVQESCTNAEEVQIEDAPEEEVVADAEEVSEQ